MRSGATSPRPTGRGGGGAGARLRVTSIRRCATPPCCRSASWRRPRAWPRWSTRLDDVRAAVPRGRGHRARRAGRARARVAAARRTRCAASERRGALPGDRVPGRDRRRARRAAGAAAPRRRRRQGARAGGGGAWATRGDRGSRDRLVARCSTIRATCATRRRWRWRGSAIAAPSPPLLAALGGRDRALDAADGARRAGAADDAVHARRSQALGTMLGDPLVKVRAAEALARAGDAARPRAPGKAARARRDDVRGLAQSVLSGARRCR